MRSGCAGVAPAPDRRLPELPPLLACSGGGTVSASCTPRVRGRLARSRPEIAGIAAVAYLLYGEGQHY